MRMMMSNEDHGLWAVDKMMMLVLLGGGEVDVEMSDFEFGRHPESGLCLPSHDQVRPPGMTKPGPKRHD